MKHAIVFDMDDTLVWERDYVKSGFSAVAQAVTCEGLSEDEAFEYLWTKFGEGERGDLFDQLLRTYPAAAMETTVGALVEVYRAHPPSIALSEEIADLLADLRGRARIALISDGPLISQQAKVDALGLSEICDPIVLTDVWGKAYWKPHERPYETVMEALEVDPENLVYVGDNPSKDFITARKLGWHTIRLRSTLQLRHHHEAPHADYAPDEEVESIEELAIRLRQIVET